LTAIVVDASAIVDILLVRPAAELLSIRIFREADELHAPHVLDAEVLHTLRRYWMNGEMSSERGARAIEFFATCRSSDMRRSCFWRGCASFVKT